MTETIVFPLFPSLATVSQSLNVVDSFEALKEERIICCCEFSFKLHNHKHTQTHSVRLFTFEATMAVATVAATAAASTNKHQFTPGGKNYLLHCSFSQKNICSLVCFRKCAALVCAACSTDSFNVKLHHHLTLLLINENRFIYCYSLSYIPR